MSKKTESKYVKLTQREHILHRSETYMGSKITEMIEMFVIKDNDLSNIQIIKKNVMHNPGFVKLFDEILVNAVDQSIRTGKVKMITINIDDKKVNIRNDGPTIPIEMHPTEKVYNSELIFFHLLSGENYNDEEERYTGGRNGLGSKISAIFSTKFKVECCDGKQIYKQWSKKNMSIIEEPEITKAPKDSKSYTEITYYPDYSQFDFDTLTEDLKSIMYKRCLDVAAYVPDVRISVNGKTIPIKKMSDYMKMHLEENVEFFHETLDNGWEVGIANSTKYGFEQVSVCNGVSTYKGGSAVNMISLELSKQIADKIKKKIVWQDVKNKLFIFLICKIPNPTFDTQSKETLTTKMSVDIHKNSKVSNNTIKKIMKSDIVKSILEEIEMKEKLSLKRLGGGKKSKVNLPKLVDANKAGTRDSEKCSLFLTEGDCLYEETEILVFRENEKTSIKIKDVKIDDVVITHNSNFSIITNISKRIKKACIIKLKNGNVMICSKNHKWFIYNKIEQLFEFKETKEISVDKHQFIINKNSLLEHFFEIKEIIEHKEGKYDKIILLNNNEEISSSNNHKFSVLNMKEQKFEMVSCDKLDNKKHYLVSYKDNKKELEVI